MSNHITITGNIGDVPELTFTKGDMAIAEFSVCSTYGKDEKKTNTWFNVKAFGKLAENLVNTVNKGDTIIVLGRMETKEYTKKDGSKSKWTTLVADEVGVSMRWTPWVKDRTADTMKQVGKVGKPIPKPSLIDEEPF